MTFANFMSDLCQCGTGRFKPPDIGRFFQPQGVPMKKHLATFAALAAAAILGGAVRSASAALQFTLGGHPASRRSPLPTMARATPIRRSGRFLFPARSATSAPSSRRVDPTAPERTAWRSCKRTPWPSAKQQRARDTLTFSRATPASTIPAGRASPWAVPSPEHSCPRYPVKMFHSKATRTPRIPSSFWPPRRACIRPLWPMARPRP